MTWALSASTPLPAALPQEDGISSIPYRYSVFILSSLTTLGRLPITVTCRFPYRYVP